MKILHLLYESRGDYFGIGGVGSRAYEIYSRLKDRHDITLLCRKYPGARDGVIEGLKHIYAGTESRNFTKTLLSYAYRSARYVAAHGTNFDIVIEEFSPAVPTFLNFYTKRPLILQVQGYTGKEYFSKYNLLYSTALYAYEKLWPRFYRHLLFVSEESRNRYTLNRQNNILVIPNGIAGILPDAEIGDSNYIVYFGRIDIHNKGLDILLEAYGKFYEAFPGIKLVIAGDGRDMDKFLGLLDNLPAKVRANIEMKGWLEGDAKTLILKKALLVVMPSRHETQGITALESMACGKALVASDIPELAYITRCGAGISFKSGDSAALAAAMKELLTNNRRKEMGLKGRAWVRDFTWDRIALKYEEFLYSVLAGKA